MLLLRSLKAVSALLMLSAGIGQVQAADCADDPATTGLSRTIAIDSSGGQRFGRLQYPQTAPLRPKEVVLTFDDGPHPIYTKLILDILDKHCVKATFFTVGRMALFAPKIVQLEAKRGHTIASHTWSHARDLSKMPVEDAKLEIEKGFVATSQALGEPIAPFFRYPGLNDSHELNEYLGGRDISVWSVDVVSGDTNAGMTSAQLYHDTLERLHKMGRGVVLFHDLKAITAEILDSFLSTLKAEGFKIVHVVSNSAYKANPVMVARLHEDTVQNVAFTGVAVPASTGAVPPARDALATGEVDIMKTEFLQIEAGALAAKQELADSNARASADKSLARGHLAK